MSTRHVDRVSNPRPPVRLHGIRRHRAAGIEEDGDMPKYLMMIVEDEAPYSQDGADLSDVMTQHGDFSQQVEAAGAKILGGEALQPRGTATYLRGTRSGDVKAVDNPAPDVKEVVGGYYLVEAADDAQARALAELCPAPYGYIELRPIWEVGGA
jgi:hypothetical protein